MLINRNIGTIAKFYTPRCYHKKVGYLVAVVGRRKDANGCKMVVVGLLVGQCKAQAPGGGSYSSHCCSSNN